MICPHCKEDKAPELFAKRKKPTHAPYCKACMNKWNREWRQRKKEGATVDLRKEKYKRYGYSEPPDSQEHKRPNRIKWLAEHHDELIAYGKRYRKENKDLLQQKKVQHLKGVKWQVYQHLGGKCACCGETEFMFMTIDHVNGRDKKEERKKTYKVTGQKLWRRVRVEGYPDTYQMLCFNCNSSKGAFGKCPHNMTPEERDKILEKADFQ